MFVVVVSENKNGKIELTKEQLEQMLDDAYRKGKWETATSPYYIPCYKSFDTDRITITCNQDETPTL